MTSEQKKAIDACKDQAAKEFESPLGNNPFSNWLDFLTNAPDYYGQVEQQHVQNDILTRAMQLYGGLCRKEGDTQPIEEQDIVDKIRDVFDVSDMRPEAIAEHLFHWFEFKRKH